MKPCPVCHLISPDAARSCDCGYDFETGVKGSPRQLGRYQRRSLSPFSDIFLFLGLSIMAYAWAFAITGGGGVGLGGAAGLAMGFLLYGIPFSCVLVLIAAVTYRLWKNWFYWSLLVVVSAALSAAAAYRGPSFDSFDFFFLILPLALVTSVLLWQIIMAVSWWARLNGRRDPRAPLGP